MPKWVRLLTKGGTFQGHAVEAGEKMCLPDKSADSLVAAGEAEFTGDEPHDDNGDGDEKPGNGVNSGDNTHPGTNTTPKDEKQPTEPLTEETKLKLSKALDGAFHHGPLADAAKEAGVEFAYDAKKYEIVMAIIEQGKAQAVLALQPN